MQLITDSAALAIAPERHARAMIRNPFRHLVTTPQPGDVPALRDAVFRERIRRMDAPVARAAFTNRFMCLVLDAATKRVVRRTPWTPNLILDQGMNGWATTFALGNIMSACAVGTGTTPVVRDSTGTAQLTVTGTTCTADNPFFEAGDEGRLLKLDSGGEAYIATFNTSTDVTLATAPGDAGPEDGAVWYVNETGLSAEVKRTTAYLTGAGNCGTSDVGNVRTYKRTFDFSAEVAPANYTELGWSHSASAGNNLNCRALISGGSVAVGTGQQLRVIYEFILTTGTNTSTPATSTITGWPVAPATIQDGDMILSRPFSGLSSMNTNGVVATVDPYEPISAPSTGNLFLSTTATLPIFGNNYGGAGQVNCTSAANASYTAGSFTRGRVGTWNLSTANATNWRGVCRVGASTSDFGWVMVWDEAQTKSNTHVLQINMAWQWSRPLTNP